MLPPKVTKFEPTNLLYRFSGEGTYKHGSFVTTKEFTLLFPVKEKEQFVKDGMPIQLRRRLIFK